MHLGTCRSQRCLQIHRLLHEATIDLRALVQGTDGPSDLIVLTGVMVVQGIS